MGTLWLGGAEGLIAQNFTQITGADTGFPEGGDFTSTPPPLDIVRVTSSTLRKIEKHPPPTIAAAQKRTAAAQKTELPKSWGGLQPPLPPASYAYDLSHPWRHVLTRADPTGTFVNITRVLPKTAEVKCNCTGTEWEDSWTPGQVATDVIRSQIVKPTDDDIPWLNYCLHWLAYFVCHAQIHLARQNECMLLELRPDMGQQSIISTRREREKGGWGWRMKGDSGREIWDVSLFFSASISK